MAKPASAWVDRWTAGAGAGQTAFAEGVRNTNVDVVGRAIAQQGVLVANFNQAVTSGKWARRLGEVGTSGWKSATIAKAGNYGTGIAAARDKYQAAAQKLQPYVTAGQDMIRNMPKGSLADSKARASAWIDYMSGYQG